MSQYGKNPLYKPKKIFAVGDIHGDAQKLKSLLSKIKMNNDDHLVFVGDLLGFDGENLETLKILKNKKLEHKNTFFIKGNHDEGLLGFLQGKAPPIPHLKSLMNKNPEKIEAKEALDFLKKENVLDVFTDMIEYYETERCIITHAPIDINQWAVYGGFNYLEDLEEDDLFMGRRILDNMAWELRQSFIENEQEKIPGMNKFLICGHQFLSNLKTKEAHRSPRVFKHRAFLDCGCGYRKTSPLFALEYPSKKIIKS